MTDTTLNIDDEPLNAILVTRQRCRLILLLEALERAGVTPIASRRLHGFAFLADVLSPVWNLPAFDGKVLKIEDGPHYPDLQKELDNLVILGLVDVKQLRYIRRGSSGARVDGKYQLRFESDKLTAILAALGADRCSDPLDPSDREQHKFLVELAGAMATLPDDEIDIAAMQDATYSSSSTSVANIIDFGEWARDSDHANRSLAVTKRFENFVPNQSRLSPGERVYLYASYLGRRIRNAKH